MFFGTACIVSSSRIADLMSGFLLVLMAIAGYAYEMGMMMLLSAPPAPCVAEAGPESQQQEVVEQRLRYHDDSGATAPLP